MGVNHLFMVTLRGKHSGAKALVRASSAQEAIRIAAPRVTVPQMKRHGIEAWADKIKDAPRGRLWAEEEAHSDD